MLTDVAALHFIRPWWFLAFLPLLAYLVWYWFFQGHKSDWQRYLDPQLAQHVLLRGTEGKSKKWLYAASILLASSLVILALAGPAWEKIPQPVFKNRTAIVVVLDMSRSMDSIDLKPSRLVRAKQKLNDLLQLNKGGQMALIVYAANAYVVTPLTDDINTIATHIPNLSTELVQVQGSRPDRALLEAKKLLEQAHVNRGQIVLLTDSVELNKENKAVVSALTKNNHRLSVIGVGTPEGAPIANRQTRTNAGKKATNFVTDEQGNIVIPKLDIKNLSQIAQLGGGSYATMTVSDEDIKQLNVQSVDNQGVDKPEAEDAQRTSDEWRDMGAYLLLLVIPFFLLGFQRGVLFSLYFVAFLIIPSKPVYAIELPSVLLNKDQQAKRAFDQQQYDKAREKFTQPEWQASAAYKQGDFEQAIKSLEGNEHPDALYNAGNAYARMGELQQAIEQYEKSLQIRPNDPDTEHNLELVKKALEQQQNQQEQNQQQDNEQQKSDSQDKDDSQQQSDEQQSDEQQSEQEQGDQEQNQQQEPSDNQQQQNDQQSQGNESQSSNQQPDGQQAQQDEPDQQSTSSEQQEQSEDAAEQQQKSEGQEQQSEQDEVTEEESQQPVEMSAGDNSEADNEEQQQLQQWLRRVEDDPGGLLRRKFQYQDYINKQKAEKQKW